MCCLSLLDDGSERCPERPRERSSVLQTTSAAFYFFKIIYKYGACISVKFILDTRFSIGKFRPGLVNVSTGE